MLYLSSHLRKNGFRVEVYDATFGSREELFRMLKAGPPSVIGIYSTLMTRPVVLNVVEVARVLGWTVVLGGPEPSAYPEQYLDAGAHLIIEGEAENTLAEVLIALRNPSGSSLHKIPGLIFRESNGSLVRTSARVLIADLDSQPWPDRERISIEKYLRAWRERHGTASLSLITARGCPFHCRWCSRSIFGRIHRRRSAGDVVNEVEWLMGKYQPDMLWIADDVFTIQRNWILEYARLMKEKGLRVPFEAITRADRMDAQVADALADLNCSRIWIGCESGSQRVLDAMERGVTLDQVKDAFRICRERGIKTGMFVMWGYEGEDLEDIEATIENVKSARPDLFLTVVSYPIKGTQYYDQVAARLMSPRPWSESTDRDLVITGRRSREFYSCADRLLKAEIALQKLTCNREDNSAGATDLHVQIEKLRRELFAAQSKKEDFVPGIL
jgi:radical SAM superfamily enzyme YgiQ (UPF0313 family)